MRHALVATLLSAAFATGQPADTLRVTAGGSALLIDKSGNIKTIASGGKTVVPPGAYSFFELDGKLAEAGYIQGGPDVSFNLAADDLKGVLKVSGGKNVRFLFQPAAGTKVKNVGLALTFPLDTVFHLAEFKNIGRMLDKDMPVGETYKNALEYNFFVAEWRGLWIRFRSSETRDLRHADAEVTRHARSFTATFTWRPKAEAQLAVFSSLDELLAEQQAWMEAETGLRKMKDRGGVPAWIHDIRLIITLDMMRSNWEIAHDFKDLLNLAKEIKALRNPKEVLFYIPGWYGAYDSTHPTYRPHAELGGEARFREALDYLHKEGFHVMAHSTLYGIDPYRPENESLYDFGVKNEKGQYMGFMFESWGPPKLYLKYRTPRIPLNAPAGTDRFRLRTDSVPDDCEAMLSIGGVPRGKARISLTIGRRTLSTPPGWFETHDAYDFPFPMALAAGVNEINAAVTGGTGDELRQAWYQTRSAFKGDTLYQGWTFPILMGDTTKPAFQDRFVANLKSVIDEFKIDALHIDAGFFYIPQPGKELFYKMRNAAPQVAIGAENYLTFEEMNFYHFSQIARLHLKNYRGTLRLAADCSSYAAQEGLDELYAWLNKPSPVCRFAKDYIIVYPHLCAADAFVPIGKVCNLEPPRQMPPTKQEQWKMLAEAKRLDFTPAIRVNYRKYGLDADSRKAIRELGR